MVAEKEEVTVHVSFVYVRRARNDGLPLAADGVGEGGGGGRGSS